jgi:uncharacterized protein (TIGR02246 family)
MRTPLVGRAFSITLAWMTLMTSTLSMAQQPTPAPALAESQLRAINHRFVNAFAVADPQFMQSLTAQDFFMIGNAGEWMDRDQHLNAMRQAAVAGGVSYDAVQVRLYGKAALVHGWFEGNALAGAPVRVRYTDVYQWSGSAWELVAAQNTPVRDGVAKALQRGNPPTTAPWRGPAPAGDDMAQLTALNENYVRAFRDADVAWYDAHLAPDYLVINSDGSLNDRAKALENFAKPTFATHFKSYPVSEVRIRRFHDIALIHAENAYEMKDGKKGVSRYTDIWHRQPDGRWLCVAAHLTTHRAPQ